MNPIDGLTYWFDATAQAWKAIGRTDIPIEQPPGTGAYGSAEYGERPYGD
jgi:hypothetical protein